MPENRPARVIVVSTQPVYLRGLASLVMSMPGASLVGEARSIGEALQLCQLAEPDLAVFDLNEAPGRGQEAAGLILERWPGMKIVLLSDTRAEIPAADAAFALPLNFFSRDIGDDEFRAGLEQVLQEARQGKWNAGRLHGSTGQGETDDSADPLHLPDRLPVQRNHEVLTRELVMAGKIQADILPEAPSFPGWDISAVLEPARETSGDFYDFLPLSNRKWGLVVADVTDKGMGAALFMALSSALFRTYATQFPTLPAVTLGAVSRRILSDTRGSMFVTAFYGVLEPFTGRFIYANAGHPPGFIIATQHGKESIESLRTTGMSLGVIEQAEWKQRMTRLNPGDLLVLYTDGITEAENPQGEAFGEDRLIDVAFAKANCTAQVIQTALLDEVHHFVGSAPRQDDIALIVIRREK
ncbi:MAG TPA: SpoIIE family protein phosphatase [Anaerolineaceae bacterium]|jgi:DNA-binding NarL/FixJ family response regulator